MTSQPHQSRQHRVAFTLIELLVVISIIGLLMGLLAPSLKRARETAQTTQCASNLKNIGAAFTIYTDEYPDALPIAVSMPDPIDIAPPNEKTFMKAMLPHLKDQDIYCCPADVERFTLRGTSYEYLAGLMITLDPRNAVAIASIARKQPHLVPILCDGDEVHPAPLDVVQPLKTVYYDAHVDWLWDAIPNVDLPPVTE
ncbi:MAG: type II secretion system protein [Phycisphaeraceae bacterium]|nr:type II secretion system protein [Phycisphaeraceae bacterium]